MSLSISLSTASVAAADVDVLAIGVTEGGLDRQKQLTAVDEALGGALTTQIAKADFTGKGDQVLDVTPLGRIPARRVTLIGLGPKRGLGGDRLRKFAASAARAAQAGGAKTLALGVPDKADVGAIGEGLSLGVYRFTKYFTGERKPQSDLTEAAIHRGVKTSATDRKALARGVDTAYGVCIARDAVNEPPNELTPAALADLAKAVAKEGGLKAKVLDKAGIQKAGMKLHYAVGQGSVNEPRLIHLSYTPKRPKKRVVLVGKGLTFDSGGLCIKPAPGMGEMKSDMGGAAAVLGTIAAVARLKPNVEVHVVIGSAENMPDGAAYRPGDVFGSLDGKTVEIINTDAEGRLVLADALAYARKLEPDLIIDAATLTGACVVALGKNCTGFYTGDDRLAKSLSRAASAAGENLWRMPLLEDLRDQLKSSIADLKHTGDRWGGSITAALFLREFVGDVPWIHCDIAGPSFADAPSGVVPKGGTGHPVMTFVKFIDSLA